jgi:DNA-binding MarR family transcriptional regulator
MILYGTLFTPPPYSATGTMTLNEVSKRTDKTPLGTLLSILTSFEVLARYLEVEFKQYEVSLIRFNIMSTLFKNGGEMTPSEIAESVFREKNSITAVLNTMEKQGVIRREPSANDRRSVRVVITDKGWNEANRLNPVAQEMSRKALSCLERGRVEELVEAMRTIRESLMPGVNRNSGRPPAGTPSNDGGLQRNRGKAALNIDNEGIMSL